MVRGWVSWALFVSSYAPLFLLLAVQSWGKEDGRPVFIASGVLLIVGAVGTAAFLQAAKRKESGDYTVVSVKSRDADVAAYAVGYLLPFVTAVDGGWRDQVSLGLFLLLLGLDWTSPVPMDTRG
jgi:hypothetical protein